MENRQSLFRPAAIAASRRDGLGQIVLVRPVSFRMLISAFVLIASALVALLCFGSYTAHSTLRGRLVPDSGVIDVHSPQFGTIVEKHIAEGQSVERGAVLYVISSERMTSSSGATQLAVAEQLGARRRSLREQIANTRRLEKMERESLDETMAALSAEGGKLDETLAGQQERVALAQQAAARYETIRAQGFVSEEQAHGRRTDLLEQRARLQTLERERSSVARELGDAAARAAAVDLRYANQIADLERAMTAVDLELAENEARRGIVVTAPESGIATGVAANVGQAVDVVTPLAFIVPHGSALHAELYAPSRAVGFVSVGDDVLLRYEAYPYQKFGHYRGNVTAVSQNTLSRAPLGGGDARPAAEPVYEVLVKLQSQTVRAYGAPRDLRAGMVVEADVLLETRRLYEWVLEPLYSLTGKIS